MKPQAPVVRGLSLIPTPGHFDGADGAAFLEREIGGAERLVSAEVLRRAIESQDES